MRVLIENIRQVHRPESLVQHLHGQPGVILLRSFQSGTSQARYSFVVARPFLTFRSAGARCEMRSATGLDVQFGDPWCILEGLLSRYELRDELDLPFPLGGCFGYWGYELKNFIEPRLSRRALNDLELPECCVGFYDSVVVFDHHLGATWVLSTGLGVDSSRDEARARRHLDFFRELLSDPDAGSPTQEPTGMALDASRTSSALLNQALHRVEAAGFHDEAVFSNLADTDFIARVQRAQNYIRAGDIYQVNLSQRLTAAAPGSGWDFFQCLGDVSPAPFSAYVDAGDFEIISSSPELFLRLSGAQVRTRPIKGTRPRSMDPTEDAQLRYKLQTSPKELAELVMITDLLRNDLGKFCEFGSIHVPELARLEAFPQVQHLVSTVEGTLGAGVSHLDALAACFPGGSITGAPKIRAMELIDELEPVCRGPYTGALGYLGFNRESQFSITIRTAVQKEGLLHFQVGAGIVADSNPEAEYFETLAKARGFVEALVLYRHAHDRFPRRQIRT